MRPLDIFLAISVAVLWGGNFVAAKYGIAYFPPFFISALRFAIVSSLLLPFVPRATKKQVISLMPIALMSTMHFSLLFVALSKGLDIASCVLGGQLGVPFACILGAIFLNDRIGIFRISGIVISFLGIGVVSGAPSIMSHLFAFSLVITSSFCWGVANVLVKRLEGLSPMTLLAYMAVEIIPCLLVLTNIFEPSSWHLLKDTPWSAIFSLSYTAVGSTICAYGIWYYLLSRYSVSQVTPYSLLTPIFGIGFGQIFFAEELTQQLIAGGIITIIGVAVIVMRRPKIIMLGEAS